MIQKVPIGKYFIYADSEDGTGHLFTEQGEYYEPHVRAELEKFIPTCKAFLDIGANVGFHTILAKSIRRDVPIVSIEVNPISAGWMLKSINDNELDGITVLPLAVSDFSHVIQSDFSTSNATCAALRSWKFNEDSGLSPSVPLDFFDLLNVDLVKMDIDGYEHLALKGASRLMAQQPRFIFEYHLGVVNRSGIEGPELLEFFISRGYSLTVLDFIPGIRATFQTAIDCHQHVLNTTGLAVDILAEPI